MHGVTRSPTIEATHGPGIHKPRQITGNMCTTRTDRITDARSDTEPTIEATPHTHKTKPKTQRLHMYGAWPVKKAVARDSDGARSPSVSRGADGHPHLTELGLSPERFVSRGLAWCSP